MKLKINKLIFVFIILLALILRFYKLGQIPPGLDWDENSNAYNAYSILKTARDEYGNFLPLTNRSFDDYKPPMYMYLNVPSVAVFGLTPFAARLPSAILGFLTVPLIYFLAKKLFEKQSFAHESAIVAMFLLAISPWHIQFSRVGFEANVGLFFATAAICAFHYGLKNRKLLVLSAVLVGLSAYTYHAQRVFVPLMFLALIFIFKKEIFAIPKRFLIVAITITLLVILPLLIFVPTKVIFQRFDAASAQTNFEDVEKSIILIQQDSKYGNLIHNRRLVMAKRYLGNYLSHFDLNFLFAEGDNNFRHHIQDMGMLYLFELPLLLFGLYSLVKNNDKTSAFILSWLLIAPIAAAPVNPAPHANRSLPMVIALTLISAYSISQILKNKFQFKKQFSALIVLVIFVSFFVYLHNYFSHYSYEKASFWQYGYAQSAQESEKYKNQFDRVIVDKSIEQAYIFWLFNTKYDPKLYQQNGSREHFGKFYFNWEKPQSSNDLFIADAKVFPQGYIVLKTIYYLSGEEDIKIGHPR